MTIGEARLANPVYLVWTWLALYHVAANAHVVLVMKVVNIDYDLLSSDPSLTAYVTGNLSQVVKASASSLVADVTVSLNREDDQFSYTLGRYQPVIHATALLSVSNTSRIDELIDDLASANATLGDTCTEKLNTVKGLDAVVPRGKAIATFVAVSPFTTTSTLTTTAGLPTTTRLHNTVVVMLAIEQIEFDVVSSQQKLLDDFKTAIQRSIAETVNVYPESVSLELWSIKGGTGYINVQARIVPRSRVRFLYTYDLLQSNATDLEYNVAAGLRAVQGISDATGEIWDITVRVMKVSSSFGDVPQNVATAASRRSTANGGVSAAVLWVCITSLASFFALPPSSASSSSLRCTLVDRIRGQTC